MKNTPQLSKILSASLAICLTFCAISNVQALGRSLDCTYEDSEDRLDRDPHPLRSVIVFSVSGLPKGRYFAQVSSGGSQFLNSAAQSNNGKRKKQLVFTFDSSQGSGPGQGVTHIQPGFLARGFASGVLRNVRNNSRVTFHPSIACKVIRGAPGDDDNDGSNRGSGNNNPQ